MRPEILNPLFTPVTDLPGIGPKSAALIERVAGPHVWDLIRAQPSRMQQRTRLSEPSSLCEDQLVTLPLFVLQHFIPRSPKAPYRVTCMAGDIPVSLVFFTAKGAWLQGRLPVREVRLVSVKLARFNNNWQITHPDYIVPEEEEDAIPAVEPIYPLTQGLTSRVWNKALNAALELVPTLPEWVDASLQAQQKWPEWTPSLQSLHFRGALVGFVSVFVSAPHFVHRCCLQDSLGQGALAMVVLVPIVHLMPSGRQNWTSSRLLPLLLLQRAILRRVEPYR